MDIVQQQLGMGRNPTSRPFVPTFQFNEFHQESIKGFETVSNYDLIIQNSQELVKAQRSDTDLLDLIINVGAVFNDIFSDYESDSHCPESLKKIKATINQILFNFEDPVQNNRMRQHLKGAAFDYFFKPLDQQINIAGQSVRISLFLADIMTLVGSLEEQKEKIRFINSENKPNLRDDQILVNGEDVSVVNRLNEASGSFEGVTSLNDVVNPGDPLILKNDGDSYLLIEHSQLMRIIDSNPVDPMTRRPLEESSYQILNPLGRQMRLFVAVDVPYGLIRQLGQIQNPNESKDESLFLNVPDKSLFMSIPTDSNGGNPLPIPSAPPSEPFDDIEVPEAFPVIESHATMVGEDGLEVDIPVDEAEPVELAEAIIIHDLPTPSAPSGEFTEDLTFESQLFYKWMYQPNDPLSYQFSNAQVSTSLTENQRRQSITGAIQSQGQRPPFVSAESQAIDRFFTHFRNEIRYFKQASIKQQISQIHSSADLEANDEMQVTLARFIDLLQIKQQYLAYWEYPSAPYNIGSVWDQFQLLKENVSINF